MECLLNGLQDSGQLPPFVVVGAAAVGFIGSGQCIKPFSQAIQNVLKILQFDFFRSGALE
jgi:hypothetical protein